jgi:transcriptional regulator with XRE-family HTH domain/tetratricopeptide (TPR) repeat protein
MDAGGTAELPLLLRAHRQARDLTIEGLAELSGVSERTIGDIERGVSASPRRQTVVALADGLALAERTRDAFLHAARAARAARRAAPSATEAEAHRPHWLEDFTGRDRELSEILGLMRAPEDEHPRAAIVISGTPGSGKSSLAVEAVRRWRTDEVVELFVDLAGASSHPMSALAILQSLLRQLTPDAPAPRGVPEAAAAWRAATAERSIVVILDDASHESQVRPVLAATGRTQVIVTSRRALPGLEGARHLTLGVLPRADSIALLERAIPEPQRRDSDLDELARLCGDLPLALRVAAGRISARSTRSADEFTARLRHEEQRLQLLVAGDLGVESAFAASCFLLRPERRRLFQSLGLMAGPSFDAVMAAAADESDVDETAARLEELVDLGLLEALEGERYRMHDLLRLYALKVMRSEVADEEVERRRRHFRRWLLSTAAHAGALFAPENDRPMQLPAVLDPPAARSPGAASAWLRAEVAHWWPAIRRAAQEGRHDEVVAAADGLSFFGDRWLSWGHWHELFLLRAESAHVLGDVDAEASALGDAAYMFNFAVFDDEKARETALRGLRLEGVAPIRRARLLNHLGEAESRLGLFAEAEAHAREGVAISVAAEDPEEETNARLVLADAVGRRDPGEAIAQLETVLEMVDAPHLRLSAHFRTENRFGARATLIRMLVEDERWDEAISAATAMLETPTDDASWGARALRHRGFARRAIGDVDGAREDFEEALRRAGDHRPDWWAEEIQAALAELSPDPR